MWGLLRRVWLWLSERSESNLDASVSNQESSPPASPVVVSKGRRTADTRPEQQVEPTPLPVSSSSTVWDVEADDQSATSSGTLENVVPPSIDHADVLEFPEVIREYMIGLDVGSSCSKICVYDNATGRRFFVHFGEFAQEQHPNLVDTSLFTTGHHVPRLVRRSETATNTEIKQRYFREYERSSGDLTTELQAARELLVIYISELLQYTIGCLGGLHGGPRRRSRMALTINVGIPSAAWIDTDDTHQLVPQGEVGGLLRDYRAIVLDACNRFRSEHRIDSTETLSSMDDTHEVEIAEVNVVPEVIAELVPLLDPTKDGMNMIMDIGRGTVDLICFIVGPDLLKGPNDRRFTILANSVKWLGTQFLENMGGDGDSKIREITTFVHDVVFHAYGLNRLASEWDKNIQLYILGGGRALQQYDRAISEASSRLGLETIKNGRIGLLQTTKPGAEDVDVTQCIGHKPEDIHRLLVAYGLTFPVEDIGVVCTVAGTPLFRQTSHSFELNPDLY